MNELYLREHKALREELHNLKSCQITFLTWSVVATVALLTFFAKYSPTGLSGLPFLLPLGIILPCWWIFFDKATTITRIIGYYRQIEKLILGKSKPKNYLGWENALALFREYQQAGDLTFKPEKNFLAAFWKDLSPFGLIFHTRRYWLLVHYTFFGLSALC